MTTTAVLQLGLRPNVGWIVNIIRDGRNEGPTHSGHYGSKGEAMDEAERAAARMRKRGVDVSICSEHVTYPGRR